MAALEPYGDFIRELFDTGKTHDAISTALKQSGAPKCSFMTVRPKIHVMTVQTKDSPCNGLQRDGFRTLQGRCERVVASRCKEWQGVARD